MYRRFFALMTLTIGGVLAGCDNSASIFVQAGGTHWSGGTLDAAAKFLIAVPGTYDYELTFARMPPQPGSPSQVCTTSSYFQLIDEDGGISQVSPPSNATDDVAGSIDLTGGMWTGISEGSIEVGGVFGGPNSPGTFDGLACPWSLTLTPST
jgi:hypothetical protein